MTRRARPMFAAIATLLTATAVLPAPAHAAAAGKAGQRLQAAMAQLDLSADQKGQIKQILADARTSAGATTEPAAGAHAKGRAVLKQVMAVLTADQKTKLKQILKAGHAAKA